VFFHVRLSAPKLTTVEEQESSIGQSVTHVSIALSPAATPIPDLGFCCGILNPKLSSIQAIKAFKPMGIEVFMMIGDSKLTALAVAKLVGIEARNGQANIRNPKGS